MLDELALLGILLFHHNHSQSLNVSYYVRLRLYNLFKLT